MASNEIRLITTTDNVKMIAVLDDNIAENYLRAAIMEAQEVGLRGILGSALLDAVKAKIAAGTLAGAYAVLVNTYCVFYLAYATKAELLPKVAYKASNAGVVKAQTEGFVAATAAEIEAEVARAQAKADYYGYAMQKWLRVHAAEMPELTQRDCDRINACLRSADNLCPIDLGGARGAWNGRDLWENLEK